MSVTVVAEIGINFASERTGSADERFHAAVELIHAAADAGCDYAKFQKREPELAVPKDQWDKPKATPWGETMPYIEYRRLMEFDFNQYVQLQREAKRAGIAMFFSVWDLPSLEFAERFACPFVKIPSAKLTDTALVRAAAEAVAQRGAPGLIISTGMSTPDEIEEAAYRALGQMKESRQEHLDQPTLWLLHCHSAYPAPVHELNLFCIQFLAHDFADIPNVSIGYSGHEYGRSPTEWAVAMGAGMVERHITLDRNAKGSDHSASLEPWALRRMVEHIRSLEVAMGDGVKFVHESEMPALLKLRGGPTPMTDKLMEPGVPFVEDIYDGGVE